MYCTRRESGKETLMVADIEELEHMDASESTQKKDSMQRKC